MAANHPSTYEHERVAMLLMVFSGVLGSVAFGGVVLFVRVPAFVVRDMIQRFAGRVRQMGKRDTSEDEFNHIMGFIQEAHEMTVRLSALLAPVRLERKFWPRRSSIPRISDAICPCICRP